MTRSWSDGWAAALRRHPAPGAARAEPDAISCHQPLVGLRPLAVDADLALAQQAVNVGTGYCP